MKPRYKLIVLLLLLLAVAAILFTRERWALQPRMYEDFGLKLPEAYPMTGIDVSRYQDFIFWKEVAAMQHQNRRLSFVFIKATDGNGNIDKHFARNWDEARKAGLIRGAYHFFHPSVDVASQAERYLSTVTLAAGDLVPVLDVEQAEQMPAPALRDSVCRWLTIVERRLKVRPIVYTGAFFYNEYLLGYVDDYPLWIAHYKADKPGVRRDWHFWQISDCGQVNGIGCPVDFNVFSGDSTALRAFTMQ